MRSPSRDPQKPSIKEQEVIKDYQNSQVGAPVRYHSLHSIPILPPHIFIRFPVVVVDWAISVVLELVMLLEKPVTMALLSVLPVMRLRKKNSTFLNLHHKSSKHLLISITPTFQSFYW